MEDSEPVGSREHKACDGTIQWEQLHGILMVQTDGFVNAMCGKCRWVGQFKRDKVRIGRKCRRDVSGEG